LLKIPPKFIVWGACTSPEKRFIPVILPVTILARIFNKWTGLGVGLIIYSFVAKGIKINGKTLLPHGSKLEQIGKRLLTGGAFGGVFDAPADGTKEITGTRHIQLAGTQTDTVQKTFHNTGNQILVQDSAESSLRGI